MHGFLAVVGDVLWVAVAIAGAGFMIWLKYNNARRYEEQKEHKADIETLFGGKK